jgi:phospho-N-acetylmuramoyl-pentapeptide-transferase
MRSKGISVDAKFLASKPINLTGKTLLWVLALGMMASAIIADLSWGRLLSLSAASLTLPLGVSALTTALLGGWVVPLLGALKTGQFIRQEGPQGHLKKAGTPTMGGVFFIPVALMLALLVTGFSTTTVALTFLTLAYAAIGWLDDWQVLRQRSNRGISPRTKLGFQIAAAIAFCLWMLGTQPPSLTTLVFPLGLVLPLGVLFWPLAGFVLVAESNATNLTDGLDGLMGGTGAIAFLGMALVVGPDQPELMVFSAAMAGACVGFLCHNRNPARVFMGDTGSLALGAALAGVGLLSGQVFALLILTLLFFAETLSVIVQVVYFKATKGPDGVGKRFFKMAPLHHHFELCGWSEIQVVAIAYGVTALLVALALSLP